MGFHGLEEGVDDTDWLTQEGLSEFPVVASGFMGTVLDRRMVLTSASARNHLMNWLHGARSAGIEAFEVGRRSTRVTATALGTFTIPEVPSSVEWGGNAHNTFLAMHRVAEAHGMAGSASFVADYAEGLDTRLKQRLAIPPTADPHGHARITLRSPLPTVPIRESLVIEGEGDPIYLKIQPSELTAPPLPDAPLVFISSYSCDQTGEDLWTEIRAYRRRNPQGKILLSPGSVQIKQGIPKDIFGQLHLLACNRSEACALLERLGGYSAEIFNAPEKLTQAFLDLGVKEVRITDGGRGVYARAQHLDFYRTPVIDRHHPLVLKLVRRHLMQGPELAHLQKNPDFNGCGDARLGVELAARALHLFNDPRKAVLYSALLATLQSYNPHPNIGNFSDRLIYDAIGITEQLFDDPDRLAIPLAAK